MTDYCTLKGDIDHDEASFDHFRSELTCLTPCYNAILPYGQGQVNVRSVTYVDPLISTCAGYARRFELINCYGLLLGFNLLAVHDFK